MDSGIDLALRLVGIEKKGIPLVFAEGEEALWPLAVLPIQEPKRAKSCEANYWLLGPMQLYQ